MRKKQLLLRKPEGAQSAAIAQAVTGVLLEGFLGKRYVLRDPRGVTELRSGVRCGTSRTCPCVLRAHTADESGCARQMVARHESMFQCRVRHQKGRQAVAALHLTRMSDASLKFQRL